MDKVPDEIFKKIINYLGCTEFVRYDLLCKLAQKNCKCNIIKFKCLYGCTYHSSNKYEIVKKLINYNDNGTIHFKTSEDLNIAKPYVCKLGRTVSHFCCGNTGVTFYSKDGIRRYDGFY